MNYDEANVKAREIADKYRKEIERELSEQFVSPSVAALLSYELAKAVEDVGVYLQKHELCTQPQFLRALEIVLRNRAKLTAEQLEVFSRLSEEPGDVHDDENH